MCALACTMHSCVSVATQSMNAQVTHFTCAHFPSFQALAR